MVSGRLKLRIRDVRLFTKSGEEEGDRDNAKVCAVSPVMLVLQLSIVSPEAETDRI